MTADQYSREYRLRKQAEWQMLHGSLSHLREREDSYIAVAAAVPLQMANQIRETRRDMRAVEEELLTLHDHSINEAGHRLYWQAYDAEIKGDVTEAVKLYKEAAREGYVDANPALRSLRYRVKANRRANMGPGSPWLTAIIGQSGSRFWLSLLVLVGAGVMVMLFIRASLASQAGTIASATATPTVTVVIVVVPTATTPTAATQAVVELPTPTETSEAQAPPVEATSTPEPTPTLTPTLTLPLRAAPRIIGPRNDLVWQGGAVVFEFEEMGLAEDELYCVDTLRGFDQTNTENWSYRPAGSKSPSIPVEANVFEVAESQGMRCIVWSAAIGKDSCDLLVSEKTSSRIIGLPEPCQFN
jgi:hypothetical protein